MKKALAAFLLSAAILTGAFAVPQNTYAECEHTFKVVQTDGINYLIEYDCDGSVVNVTVLED